MFMTPSTETFALERQRTRLRQAQTERLGARAGTTQPRRRARHRDRGSA